MTLSELKAIAKDRGLRGCVRMRKAELAALLQGDGRTPMTSTEAHVVSGFTPVVCDS